MAEEIFDAALDACGEHGYTEWLQSSSVEVIVRTDVQNPLGTGDLPFRDIGQIKKLYTLFDVQKAWESRESPRQVVASFLQGGAAALPEGIRPAAEVPVKCKMHSFKARL